MTLTYQTAKNKLATARREADGKPLENNTRLYERVNTIAVRFHSTDVVTYYQDGTMMLNSGGWRSVTTIARIRDYSGARIVSSERVWYVPTQAARDLALGHGAYWSHYGWLNAATGYKTNGPAVRKGLEMGLLVPFTDGMRVDRDGFAL